MKFSKLWGAYRGKKIFAKKFRNGPKWREMAKKQVFQKIQDGRQAAILNQITSIFKLVRDLLGTTSYVKYRKDSGEIADGNVMTAFGINMQIYTCLIVEPSMRIKETLLSGKRLCFFF